MTPFGQTLVRTTTIPHHTECVPQPQLIMPAYPLDAFSWYIPVSLVLLATHSGRNLLRHPRVYQSCSNR